VRTAIELSFGVASEVGPGTDVLDRVHVPRGKGLFLGFFGICTPHSNKQIYDKICIKALRIDSAQDNLTSY